MSSVSLITLTVVGGGSGETSRGLGETLAVSTFLTVVGSAGDVGETVGLVEDVGEFVGFVGDAGEIVWLTGDAGDDGEIRLAMEVGSKA